MHGEEAEWSRGVGGGGGSDSAGGAEDCSPVEVQWCGHWRQFENGRACVENSVFLPKLLAELHRLRTLASVQWEASVCVWDGRNSLVGGLVPIARVGDLKLERRVPIGLAKKEVTLPCLYLNAE